MTWKYFKPAKCYIIFSEEAMSLARELRSRDKHNSADEVIFEFITTTDQPMITSLIAEVKRCNARDITSIIGIRSF